MASVVFMRGVNVGGHKAIRPAVLARELSELDAVNLGAAGTFVLRARVSAARVRKELLRLLPFPTEIMICTASEVLAAAGADQEPGNRVGRDAQQFATILARRPRQVPALPLAHPTKGPWQVRIVDVRGRIVISHWRRLDRPRAYPNEIVEKQFGMPATTRNWNTIERIRKILDNERGP